MEQDIQDRFSHILATAKSHFGKDPSEATLLDHSRDAPVRLIYDDQIVRATIGKTLPRTRLEAFVLEGLKPVCDDVPAFLGLADNVLFCRDIGDARLRKEIVSQPPADQLELAEEACAAIFRYQAAARQTELGTKLPHLGGNVGWVNGLVDGVEALQLFSHGISPDFDRSTVAEAMSFPAMNLVKWTCTSDKAAIGHDGFLRWFDFENAGLRHGAEDFAWLIGDEFWPIAPEAMADVMIDTFDPGCGHAIEDFLEYLSIYVTLHTVQRFKRLLPLAQKHGWSTSGNTGDEDSGVEIQCAAQLCRVGAYYSAQSRLTAPLTKNFESAAGAFSALEEAA